MKTNLVEEDQSHVVKESPSGKTGRTNVLDRSTVAGVLDSHGLQDSDVTAPTEAESYSGEEEAGLGGWLGGITADFRTLAVSLKETAGGVVGFVHRSALSVAAEIAEMERGENAGHEAAAFGAQDGRSFEPLRLPWEIRNDDGEYWEDAELKDRILLLSMDESNFLKPFPCPKESSVEEQGVVLDEPRIQLIRKLLEIDHNLASTHARLSGRSHIREAIFWRNYFYHCEEVRNDHVQRFWVRTMATVESSTSVHSNDSLVPDDGSTQTGEDSSYVCVTSAPTSLNSFSGLQTLDEDMVVIDYLTHSPDRMRHY